MNSTVYVNTVHADEDRKEAPGTVLRDETEEILCTGQCTVYALRTV